MKKIFKKSLACLIAVLMIVSSLPFATLTANAATTTSTATVSAYGIIKGSDQGRFTDPKLTICNDAQDGNFTIGFVNFDISNISCTDLDEVSASYNFTSAMASNCSENMGLSVWYPTANYTDFDQSTGEYKLSDINTNSSRAVFKGDNSGHIGNTTSHYSMKKLGDFTTNGSSHTVNIGNAIKFAKQNGRSIATICFMITSAGGKADENSSWTDTIVTVNKNNISVDIATDVTTVKQYVKNNISSFNGYTGTAKYTYNGTDLSNGYSDYYSNLLYDDGVFEDDTNPPYNTYGDVKCQGKLFINHDVVLMYDGVNETVLPIVASVYANNRYRFVDLIKDISTEKWMLKENWRGGAGTWSEWPTSNSELPKEYTGQENFRINSETEFRNKLKYNGNGDNINYYELFSPTNNRITLSLGYHSSYFTDNQQVRYFDIYDVNSNVYVVNYKPIVDAIISMKNVYNTIQAKGEDKYCVKDLDNFYQAVYRIMTFNPNAYSYSGNTEATVKKLAEDIKNIVEKTIPIATTEPKLGNHNIVYEYKDTNVHIKKCSEGDFEEQEEHTLGADGKCTVCKGTVIDYSAWNKAAQEHITITINDISKYTNESMAEYNALANEAIALRNGATTQADVDKATAMLLSAQTVLRKRSVTVTLLYVNDSKEEPHETKTVPYGEPYDAVSDKNVDKWTVSTDNGATTTRLNTYDKTVSIVVTKDVVIRAYQTDEKQTEAYSMVVFLGKNGVIVDIKYVAKGTELPTNTVGVPKIPFYDSGEWDTPTVIGTGETIYVRAKYTASTNKSDLCNVHFANWSREYSYDSFVRPEGINPDKQYALASDAEGKNIITYLEGVDFYAPKTSDIYVVEVQERVAKTGITGHFKGSDDTHRWATYNCKFYLPKDCTAIEWGLEVKYGANTKIMKAERISNGNEYTVIVRVKQASTITNVTCRSYVTYKQNGETKTNTIYSDVAVEQAF